MKGWFTYYRPRWSVAINLLLESGVRKNDGKEEV